MKKCYQRWDAILLRGLTALILATGVWVLSSCKDDDGLDAGDPNYFTSSRGQFTATLADGTTLYLIPGSEAGSAVVTFDGSQPLHTISLNNLTIRVDTYQGNITIPSTVTGSDGGTYTITAIGNEAFMGCRAHDNLPGLTGITLPSTVTSLGEGAFCFSSLKTIDLSTTGVTAIPSSCFGECDSLKKITIPSAIKSIGRLAFKGCDSLGVVTLNEGLESIGDNAFYGCTSKNFKLSSIPSSVTHIGSQAFASAYITTITLGTKIISDGLFTACKDLTTVTLNEGVERIGAKAFYDCRNPKFTKIDIPASVTHIGDKAFGGRGAELSSSTGSTTYWYSYITEYHMKGSTPPVLEGVLYEVNPDGSTKPVIYVPKGSLAAYKAAPGWSSLTIEEE